MLMSSPTARSLKFLRDHGYKAEVVEKWNQFSRTRKDLFNFIDIVAVGSTMGVLGVQTTSTSNMSNRVKKVLATPEYLIWKHAGNQVVVHGWSKKGAKGKRKTWQLKVVIL